MTISSPTRLGSLLIPAMLGALLLLGGCKSLTKPATCGENKGAYLNAVDRAPLTVPPGTDIPDRRNALTVPPSNGKAIDKKACLQHSPSYFGSAGRIAASPEETVADWAQAWSDRNSAAVMSMYSSQFVSDAPAGAAAWLAQRGKEVEEGPLPNGRITNLKITQQDSDQRLASFTQTFGSNKVIKLLRLIRDAGVWKIVSEEVVTAETLPDKK